MGRFILTAMLLAVILGCGGDAADQYIQEGVINFQQQKYDEAIVSYEKAIEARTPGLGRLQPAGHGLSLQVQPAKGAGIAPEGDGGVSKGGGDRPEELGSHDQSGGHLLCRRPEGRGQRHCSKKPWN